MENHISGICRGEKNLHQRFLRTGAGENFCRGINRDTKAPRKIPRCRILQRARVRRKWVAVTASVQDARAEGVEYFSGRRQVR